MPMFQLQHQAVWQATMLMQYPIALPSSVLAETYTTSKQHPRHCIPTHRSTPNCNSDVFNKPFSPPFTV